MLGTRLDDAVPLPAAQVHIQSAQPKRVSACPGPVHVDEQGVAALQGRVLQGDVALLEQPGVQVDAPVERGEPVVRHDDERRVVVHHLEHAPQRLVHFFVERADAVPQQLVRFMERVRGVGVVVEHVRALVDTREVEEQQSLVEGVEKVVQCAPPLAEDELRLVPELASTEDPLRERLGVLGELLRVERAQHVVEVSRPSIGVRERHRRVFRVDLQGADIQLEIGSHLLQIEARH